MIAGVAESWARLRKEREALVERFKKEFGHTPQGEVMPHHFEETKNKIFAELDAGNSTTYKGDKHQETIDRIIGESKRRGKVAKGIDPESIGLPPKKRGRPKGSKNKPKTQPVSPKQIGSIPDIVILRRG